MGNLVVNGGFESSLSSGWSQSILPGFSGSIPNLGRIHVANCCVPSQGDWAASFNAGDTLPNALLSQTLSTQSGVTYKLSFDFGKGGSGNETVGLNVKVEGTSTLLDETVSDASGGSPGDYSLREFFFTADGSSVTLSFADISSGTTSSDALLDEVSVIVENRPPLADNDTPSTDEDTLLSGDVLANDRDPDGDALTVVEVNGTAADIGLQITLASGALLTLNANGSFDYNPSGVFDSLAVGESDTDTFTYTASDGSLTDTATVDIAIAGVNDPPLAVVEIAATTLNDPVTVQVLDNDSDPEGDPLALSIFTNPSHGTAVVDDGGTPGDLTDDAIAYTPNTGFFGRDTFKYQIDDGNGGTDIATVFVDVINNLNLNGTSGDDILIGDVGDDTLNGLGGDDSLSGRAGVDILNGGDGDDVLDGELGNDILNGDAGKDILRGREGDDTLNGGTENDFLIGVNKDLAAPGLDSMDVLTGGTGSDRFALGNATARFYLDSTGDGSDDYAEITDFEAGIDTIELNGIGSNYTFTFDGTDTAIALGGDLVANVLGVDFDTADATFL